MTYLSEVLADNPLHYWRCADAAGSQLIDIGSAKWHMHAAAAGAGVGPATPLGYSGPADDSGAFDGCVNSIYANTGTPALIPTGDMSAEVWVWPFRNLNLNGTFLNFMNGAAPFGLARNGTQWEAQYNNVNAPFAVNYTYQTWHHLVMTFTAGNVHLYVDGTARAAAAVAAAGAFSAVVTLASNLALGNFADGYVSEAAIYSAALSAARVTAHYAAAHFPLPTPVYQQAGVNPSGGAGPVPLSAALTQLLADTGRVFHNAP